MTVNDVVWKNERRRMKPWSLHGKTAPAGGAYSEAPPVFLDTD